MAQAALRAPSEQPVTAAAAGLTAQVYAGTFIGESGTAISFFAVAVPGSPVTSLIASPVHIREQQ